MIEFILVLWACAPYSIQAASPMPVAPIAGLVYASLAASVSLLCDWTAPTSSKRAQARRRLFFGFVSLLGAPTFMMLTVTASSFARAIKKTVRDAEVLPTRSKELGSGHLSPAEEVETLKGMRERVQRQLSELDGSRKQ